MTNTIKQPWKEASKRNKGDYEFLVAQRTAWANTKDGEPLPANEQLADWVSYDDAIYDMEVARKKEQEKAEAAEMKAKEKLDAEQLKKDMKEVEELKNDIAGVEAGSAVGPLMSDADASHTETGNAKRLVDLMDGKGLFIYKLQQWIYYENGRWRLDDDGAMVRIHRGVITELNIELIELQKMVSQLPDSEIKKDFGRMLGQFKAWIKTSQKVSTINNTLKLAQTFEDVTAEYDDFDTKGHFVGVGNGVVDLRDGRLVENDPKYKMLKSSNVDYDINAVCPTFDKFVDDIMCGDEDKINMLQQIIGSCFVGGNKDMMFVFTGSGSNGKTTMSAIITEILGNVSNGGYAMSLKPSIIVGAGGFSDEYHLARLKGARMISMNETGKSEHAGSNTLQDTIVKQLVDSPIPISARPIGGTPIDFMVEGTLVLSTNSPPTVQCDEPDAIWKRLGLLRFDRIFTMEEKDGQLGEKLKKEMPGILNWCVEGAKMFLANGRKFNIPAVVKADTLKWRKDQDRYLMFAKEMLVECEGNHLKVSTEVLAAWKSWCHQEGVMPGSTPKLRRGLKAAGFELDDSANGKTLRLLNHKINDPDRIIEDVVARSRGHF